MTEMRDFTPSLLEPFGLRARRVTRAYGAFICETPQGLKIVKKTAASAGEIWFAHGAKEHLADNGYRMTDRFRITTEGEPYAVAGAECYTVRDWLPGEEPELREAGQVRWIAEELGRMSRCSAGYRAPEKSRSLNRCHELPEQLHKRVRRLENYGRSLKKNGRYTDFDLMLLDCLPLHIEQARQAESLILDPAFAREADRIEAQAVFAHHHFSNHTVLWGRDRMLITDFENACYTMPLLDLVDYTEKVLRKNDWDIRQGIGLLEAYDRVARISPVQSRILYAGLLFPGRLAELCAEVYSVRRNWTPLAYGRKLAELQEQQEARRQFLMYYEQHCLDG